MIRSARLPFLPGYSFSHEMGRNRYHKSTQFEYLKGLIPYLTEADRPGTGGYPFTWATPDTSPSLYPRRECKELPGWIAYDKQILTFDAYFQEALWEVRKLPLQIRKVKIYYFLEDGTVQVNEPKVDNSGMTQGVLIARQRIRFPKPMDEGFYDMVDFNIGKNVELYGKVFRIVNCDNFTRNFLNRMGIFVGDPLNYPSDLHKTQEENKKFSMMGKKPKTNITSCTKFYEFDKKILRFYGYWDDRSSQYGYIHKFKILFFLTDDTIEIQEEIPPNSGVDSPTVFLRRTKLPKIFDKLPGPGENEPISLLNVLATGFLKGKYVTDPLNAAASASIYYRDEDLAIGAVLNVFGRKVMLVDCDEFTKMYYGNKFGIDNFDKLPIPAEDDRCIQVEKVLPPWNGIGTYEDSEGNCRKVIPVAPKKDVYKFLVKGRVGMDSHILRFHARMVSVDSINDDRLFVISYYLTDDQISVFEKGIRNSGFATQLFCRKREIFKPDQERFVSVKPEIFQKEDLWVGNILKLEGFKFKLISADEYCLRYMELNNQEFPKSNSKLIVDKLREKLRQNYKDFVQSNLLPFLKKLDDGRNILSFCHLKQILFDLLGDDITEHEIITIARQFRLPAPQCRKTKMEVINICRTECRRKLWLGFERLKEHLLYKDCYDTGFVPEKIAVSLCKGAKIPIVTDLLEVVIQSTERNECGEISIPDLLCFFDTNQGPEAPAAPISHQLEFSEFKRIKENNDYSWIDCDCLLESIGLEEKITGEGQADCTEVTPNQASTLPH